ncbi:hypothetical protein POREN0001_0474 [Porphyromonas endodontalis ATCC 35406]|uniref:Lipoprotein n=2 Tax=Porphyromonas endodontalis TaxID=28124 RepID=C3JC74_POREA|nr:hypothetical protein POREN0001_0474 [Porphyromonas endodontalis ATCC 35406]SUB67802.1 Uncharacterised protein [Porphyromonas endodontalis]
MKRTTLIIFLLCFVPVVGCAQTIGKRPTKKDTIMLQQREVERYDFEATKNGTIDVVTEEDGWRIEKGSVWEDGALYDEYAPAKDFYKIQKKFYPNGIMRRKTSLFGGVVIGIYEEYDEAGNLIKVVDEDKKFGKIKPKDIVELLEKEGWFNRETGENKITEKEVLPTTGVFYREIIKYVQIRYVPKQATGERAYWKIAIEPRFMMWITTYIVDGETGEFTKEKTFEMREE